MTRIRFGTTAAALVLAASVLAGGTTAAGATVGGPQVFKDVKLRFGNYNPPPPAQIAKVFCGTKGFNRAGLYQFVEFQYVNWETTAVFKQITCTTGGTIGGAPTIGIPLP